MRYSLLLVALAACKLNVDYTGTYYQCNPDGTCPPGYECLDMVCVPTDPEPPACSKDVSAGDLHACAVRTDGTVWCWGSNELGQLGDGTAADRELPVRVVGVAKATQVEAGENHSCALDEMGSVWCWGSNSSGQLGDGTTSDSRTAVQVRDLAGVVQIAIGTNHGCARRDDGSVACWGNNAQGQLGDGSMQDRGTPVAITVPAARDISAGAQSACAVAMDGSVHCWGENDDGELGTGDTMPHPRPTPVVDLSGMAEVAVGDNFACANTDDGFVYCWGLNGTGQLGDGGAVASSSRPVQTQLPLRAKSLEAGNTHVCVRDELDGAWCWGAGAAGRLLNGRGDARELPARALVEDVALVSAGGEHSCVLDHDGAIRCAGFNRRGQLGDGRRVTQGAPKQIAGVDNAVAIVAGARHTCAQQMDGIVKCWGENDHGEAGNGQFSRCQLVPHPVYGIDSPDQLAAGEQHTCALLADGTMYCWGFNDSGRLGDGSMTSSAIPRRANVAGASELAIGDHSTCALVGNDARCWGHMFGVAPQTVGDVRDIVAGDDHVCAVEPDATVRCYGEGFQYQLGNMQQGQVGPPGVTAANVANATSVFARGDSTCAQLGDGSIKCWGLNESGRLGVGNFNYHTQSPASVMGLSGVMKFSMGYDASCAIKTDGTVWCWGANYFGQVGDGSYQSRTAPVQMTGLTGARDVASGGSHSCAIDSGGQVLCWGLGADGQLGDGTRLIEDPVGVRMVCP